MKRIIKDLSIQLLVTTILFLSERIEKVISGSK